MSLKPILGLQKGATLFQMLEYERHGPCTTENRNSFFTIYRKLSHAFSQLKSMIAF